MDALTLQLGRYDSLSQSVTTDHPCHDWVVDRSGTGPPPAPPAQGGGGGGDDHLPSRLQLIVAQTTVTAAAILVGISLAHLLLALRRLP